MTMLDPTRPFVLLDDARGRARLFTGIAEVIAAVRPAEVAAALARLGAAGGERAGFVAYEAAHALEPALGPPPRGGDGLPLVWFGRFDTATTVDAVDLLDDLAQHDATLGEIVPGIDEAAFTAKVGDVLGILAAGDAYQVNLTFPATVAVTGHPLALYRRLRAAAAAPYGAVVHTGSAWVLSFSPELFFALAGGQVTARPMKGTALRGSTVAADDAAAAALAADPKNRAENLMIVDLLRNDLARIAEPGSVAVPALFVVERYPTLLQMTSTITATTRVDAVAALTALFPCGSITGAPKIAAMRAIGTIEGAARGVYTGTIGAIAANGDATFNVSIRTLVLGRPGEARIGLGAGIVADSVAADEWRECLSKGAFLRHAGPAIIETMRVDGGVAVAADRHLARAAATAAFLGYPFDAAAIGAEVAAAAAGAPGASSRLRLLIAPTGRSGVELGPLPPTPAGPVGVAFVPLPVAPDDWRLRHKTTDRLFYDAARHASGAFEVVFVAPDGTLTEGSFTNVFVPDGAGGLLTPAAGGLLPGVLRGRLIDAGQAREATLVPADCTAGFFIGNAVRGLIAARRL